MTITGIRYHAYIIIPDHQQNSPTFQISGNAERISPVSHITFPNSCATTDIAGHEKGKLIRQAIKASRLILESYRWRKDILERISWGAIDTYASDFEDILPNIAEQATTHQSQFTLSSVLQW